MAECDECVLGYGYWHEIPAWHLTPDGYAIPCKRGPIERELRAYAVRIDFNTDLSPDAERFARGAVADMLRRGGSERYCYEDWMSEAIEAAAALGL